MENETKKEKVYKSTEYERARNKLWREKNHDRIQHDKVKWRNANRDKVHSYVKKYQKANPEKIREVKRRYANRQKCIKMGFKELAQIDISLFD
jgi:hypothetical protein